MRQISIDDDVFHYIKKVSTWEDNNPNDTLRRLFGIKKRQAITTKKSGFSRTVVSKEKNADLPTLISLGKLEEDQALTFRFREPLTKEYTAKISGSGLIWKGEHYSMSKLVAVILEIEGYGIPSGAYRGPAYWYTFEDKSIKDLWETYLSN